MRNKRNIRDRKGGGGESATAGDRKRKYHQQ
jgi:hypothetical protein